MKAHIFAVAFLAFFAVALAQKWRTCPREDGEFAVTVPHRRFCGSFYLCDNGTPVLFHCPGGLHFNRRLGVCDWPKRAHCRGFNGPAIAPYLEFDSDADVSEEETQQE